MDPQEEQNHRQALRRVAVHRHFPAAATLHLVVGRQNSLDFVRDLDCSTLDSKREESTRVVLGCYWQNMAGGKRRCIELVRGLLVLPQPPILNDFGVSVSLLRMILESKNMSQEAEKVSTPQR